MLETSFFQEIRVNVFVSFFNLENWLGRPWTYIWEGLAIYQFLQKHLLFGNHAHSIKRNHEAMWFRVPKINFVKCLIQRIPLNHGMRFNLNDLTILEQQNHVQKTWKRDLLTQINLLTPQSFRLKSGQNAELSHTNPILAMRFQGKFWFYEMDL